MRWTAVTTACVACGRINFEPTVSLGDGADTSCIERWQAGAIAVDPIPIAMLNEPVFSEGSPFVTQDGSEIYFRSDRAGGNYGIFRAARSGIVDFGAPTIVSELASPSSEFSAVLSPDGLTMVFTSDRPGGGSAGANVWMADRSTPGAMFANLSTALVSAVNTDDEEYEAFLSADTLRLYGSHYVNAQDIWLATRSSPTAAFGAPAIIAELVDNSGVPSDCCPTLTGDELVIVFGSRRNAGQSDLYYATRRSTTEPFSPAQPVPGANDLALDDKDPYLTPDGCTLYYASYRTGAIDLYASPL